MLTLECLTHCTKCKTNLEELKLNKKLVTPYSVLFYTQTKPYNHIEHKKWRKLVHSSCEIITPQSIVNDHQLHKH